MNKIMKRIYAQTNFLPFKDVLSVYDSLSDKDKTLISPTGKFINSPYLISRNIKYTEKRPVGFAEAYKYNGNSQNTAFIIVAVLEDYRKLGIGSELIQNTCNDCFNQGYTRIIYKCDKNNKNSAALAEKNGFQLISQTNDEFTYELTNTSNQKVYIQPSYKLYPIPRYNYYYYPNRFISRPMYGPYHQSINPPNQLIDNPINDSNNETNIPDNDFSDNSFSDSSFSDSSGGDGGSE